MKLKKSPEIRLDSAPAHISLDTDQKKRMQVLAMRVLHELRDAFDEHQLEIYDEQEET